MGHVIVQLLGTIARLDGTVLNDPLGGARGSS